MQTRRFCAFALVVIGLVASVASAVAPPSSLNARQVRTLIRRLDHESFDKRLAADNALREMGKPVVPYLRDELTRTDSLEVRHRLEVMVRDLTIDERLGQLVKQLGDKDARMRARADYALRQAGSAVVPLLQTQISNEPEGQRRRQMEKIVTELTNRRR